MSLGASGLRAITAYDAVYVALGQILPDILVTCDGPLSWVPGLAGRVERLRVEQLSNFATPSLPHLARGNGLTQEELVEAITHLAFYSGWPNAITAIGVAREVFKGN